MLVVLVHGGIHKSSDSGLSLNIGIVDLCVSLLPLHDYSILLH